MTSNLVSRTKVGERIRSEREARDLNQEEFGRFGGVSRNSQAAYEAGKIACNIDYLEALAAKGFDVGFLVTGIRQVGDASASIAKIATIAGSLDRTELEALTALLDVMAKRGTMPAKAITPQPFQLPAEEGLERAFLGVLIASRKMDEAALAHELATNLPTMLDVLRSSLTIERDDAEPAEGRANDDRAQQRA